MPQFVGELLQKNQNNSLNNPSQQSYEASLHAAKLAAAQKEQEKPERTSLFAEYTPPSGDDYEIGGVYTNVAEQIDDADEQSDFEAGYNAATGGGSLLKEKLISWAAGIFSPPGTGPVFGGATSLIQWIFREETPQDTTIETEET